MDVRRHIPHRFQVPAGTGSLEIRFHFSPTEVDGVDNLLCLTLFDPAGFRGAGHRHSGAQQVLLSSSAATPGYLAGPLPPGIWTVELDTHMVMPGQICRYELEVVLGEGEPPAPSLARSPGPRVAGGQAESQAAPAGPAGRWLWGDLHTHTLHSDAEWDLPRLLQAARSRGLDFVAVTDHNTVSALAGLEAAAPVGLLVMAGMELTTYWGHALCLGTREWIDWRVSQDGDAMAEIARQADRRAQVFAIAHPCAVGSPYCTGCTWEYKTLMPGPAHGVEVWNGPWQGDTNNEQALALWYGWLNQGHRLVATAGTDAHGPEDLGEGRAFNAVYAAGLAEPAILAALKQGHLYLSTGPRLELTARSPDGIPAMMGDSLAGGSVTLRAGWADCPCGSRVRLVAGGQPLAEWPAGRQGSHTRTLTARNAGWCLVELRGAGGQMLALTNPIYLTGFPPRAQGHDG